MPQSWSHTPLALLGLVLSGAAARYGRAQPPPGASGPVVTPPAAPPVAAVRPVRETYFGRGVADPYRWLEDSTAEARGWMTAQGAYARRVLDALPERAALAARVAALSGAGEGVTVVQRAGGFLFYLKRPPGNEVLKLYARAEAGGPERLLVDPARRDSAGRHAAVDWLAPSDDGRLVAYGLSRGGAEDAELRVVETATGRELPDRIDRAELGGVAWQPDGRAFFYVRLQALGPGAPPTAKYQHARSYLHTLGTDPAHDVFVLGTGATSAVPVDADEVPYVMTVPGSRYAVAVIAAGVRNEVRVYTAPRAAVTGPTAPWQLVADTADGVVSVQVRGDAMYLRTHRGAPRIKVIRTSLAHPDLASASTVVPEGTGVIRAIGAAQDALYVQENEGGFGSLRRVPYAVAAATPAAAGTRIPLPTAGTLELAATTPTRAGAVVYVDGWTQSSRVYAYDPAAGRFTDTGVQRRHPADVSRFVSEEVQVRAPDGVLVPLSIVHQRGIALDGSHPTLLDGYGAYGVSISPIFSSRSVAWLERGGVLATAHVRGGGELGEAWYRAGKGATKPNTWRDFLACAQYLVDRGYTTPARLAGTGTSAGGILIGRAITERPDLFGAAVIRVGAVNALRFETTPNGPPNVPEFGTVQDSLGFAALYEMDAYQHVRDGTAYPAVLLTTGLNDPRVAPWQVAKMAARLQAATASGRPVLLRVEADAGHGLGSSTRTQVDAETADTYAFLFAVLRRPAPSGSAKRRPVARWGRLCDRRRSSRSRGGAVGGRRPPASRETTATSVPRTVSGRPAPLGRSRRGAAGAPRPPRTRAS